jgi:hypothetical protein
MKKIIVSLVTIMFVIPMMAQNSAMLKLNPEKNKVYRLKSSSEQTIVQTINGNQQTIGSKVNYVLSLKMMDSTPDFMVAEIHFDTLTTNTNAMGKVTDMNSAKEGDLKSSEVSDIMSAVMNKLSKSTFYAKIDYTGKTLEIINLKMVSDQIARDTAAVTLTGPLADGIKKQILGLISESTVKTMLDTFFRYLPGKSIAVGESWKSTQNTNAGGMSLDIITTCHLDALNGNKASITAESEIKTAANAAPMQQGGATITYDDLKGLSKSAIVLDTNTGLVIEDKGQTRISGNLGISGPGFSMQMPMDITGESKVATIK